MFIDQNFLKSNIIEINMGLVYFFFSIKNRFKCLYLVICRNDANVVKWKKFVVASRYMNQFITTFYVNNINSVLLPPGNFGKRVSNVSSMRTNFHFYNMSIPWC